jgi:hypothetical protein
LVNPGDPNPKGYVVQSAIQINDWKLDDQNSIQDDAMRKKAFFIAPMSRQLEGEVCSTPQVYSSLHAYAQQLLPKQHPTA